MAKKHTLEQWYEDIYMDNEGHTYKVVRTYDDDPNGPEKPKVKDTGINKNDFNAYAKLRRLEKAKKFMFDLLRGIKK